jgi:hypothetical protein
LKLSSGNFNKQMHEYKPAFIVVVIVVAVVVVVVVVTVVIVCGGIQLLC